MSIHQKLDSILETLIHIQEQSMSKEVDDLTAAMSDLAAAVNAAAAQLKGDQHDPAAIEGFAGQAKSLTALLTSALPAPVAPAPVALATEPAPAAAN